VFESMSARRRKAASRCERYTQYLRRARHDLNAGRDAGFRVLVMVRATKSLTNRFPALSGLIPYTSWKTTPRSLTPASLPPGIR